MKKIFTVALLIFCVFAHSQEKSAHSFSFTVDGAIYPLSSPLQKSGTYFAPLTGIYDRPELRTTFEYTYTVPLHFADGALFSENSLKLSASVELSPASFNPLVKIAFTPIAFLVFETGASIGTGWYLKPFNAYGLAVYDSTAKPDNAYKSVVPFGSYRFSAWISGTFQFDLAALLPGEWNHLVALAYYSAQYEALTGSNGKPWVWQDKTNGERADGFSYYSAALLGYQMPLVLSMVGLQAEFWGYYSKSTFASEFQNWNPTFMTIGLAPVLQFKITQKQSILVQFRFLSRRSFNMPYDLKEDSLLSKIVHTPGMKQIGREWFFDRIAVSYSIAF